MGSYLIYFSAIRKLYILQPFSNNIVFYLRLGIDPLNLNLATSNPSEHVAAIDLGSNSFHMIVVRYQNGQLQVIDRVKEMVRLGGGLDKRNNLTEEAMARALEALERFG